MPQWQSRYASATIENTEHLFNVCVPLNITVSLIENEHVDFCWLDAAEAMSKVFSDTNRQAIAGIADADS
ncbi:MAG: hypothetical protein LPD71_03850 [Shewanella sp.]|nr:hypothetical protein [Shewanella sp.]MCF1430718.1 hypothetical protein [Shewanella sp.]MCF1437899.1 hypothetical protein [Shewanella sp.]MCF1458519.1 hypothetical protein [Shewanella sp.]